MGKRLVDIDDEALGAARAALGTATIKETVNTALELVSGGRDEAVDAAIDRLASIDFPDRSEAWR